MIRITSSKNPVVKEIRSLRNKSGRQEKGLFFIEGARFVEEALNELAVTGDMPGSNVTDNCLFHSGMPGNSTLHSGLHGNSVTHNSMPGKSMSHSNITGKSMPCSNKPDIRYIAVSDSFAKGAGFEIIIKPCINRGIRVYNLADSLFESVSDTVNPQGILAVLGMKRVLLEDAALNEGILVILDGIRDPGNMGTIIRTADAAGCAGVVITDGCVDLFNPKVLRSTMGSIFHLPVLHCGNTKKAADICRMKGYTVYASQTEGAVSIYEADLSGNAAFVIGSEAEGVSGEVLDSSDVLIRIPMSGRAESLNAAVAAAVIIYEAVRQKGKAAGGPPDKAVHGIAGRKPYTEQSD